MSESIGFLLQQRVEWLETALLARLKDAGVELTRPQAQLLAHLDADGIRSSQLARSLSVSRQAVHQVVRDLEKAGLVRQVEDLRNRSAKLVKWTRRGEEAARASRKMFADIEWSLAMRIGPHQMQALRKALESDWGDPV